MHSENDITIHDDRHVVMMIDMLFHANVITKLRGLFKFQKSSWLLDPTMDPFDVDAIYNDVPNGVLPMKNTQ